MAELKVLERYVLAIFPFAAAIFLGAALSLFVKTYFYDMGKYRLLQELRWIGYDEKFVKSRIENRIIKAIAATVGIATSLLLSLNYRDDMFDIFYFLILAFLAGYNYVKKTNLKQFIEKYGVAVEYNELVNWPPITPGNESEERG